MNITKIGLSLATICLVASISIAQENPSEGLETTNSKTYTVDMGDKMVKRTVEISTKRTSEVMTKESEEGQVDQHRDNMPMITKTVKIDNDEDDAFDEKIVFTYQSTTPEDFVLVSNNRELMVAIDDGENLEIIEDMSLKSKNKATYIFTNQKGKEIEFLVEEHSTLSDAKS